MGNIQSVGSKVSAAVLSGGISYLSILLWERMTRGWKTDDKALMGMLWFIGNGVSSLSTPSLYTDPSIVIGPSILGMLLGVGFGIYRINDPSPSLSQSHSIEMPCVKGDGSIKQKHVMKVVPNYMMGISSLCLAIGVLKWLHDHGKKELPSVGSIL